MKNQQQSEQSSTLKKSNTRLGKVQSLDIIYIETPNSKFPQLFDYDEEYPKARKMVLKDSAVLAITKDGQFCFLKDNFAKDEKSKSILQKIQLIYCSFTLNSNFYVVKPINHPQAQDVWLDISSLPCKLFPIKKNNVIKMGAKIIKFREVMSHDQQLPADFQQKPMVSSIEIIEQVENINNQNMLAKLCNTCNKKGELNNPLIVPCKCQINKYIHFNCLKKQLTKKLKVKANESSYTATWVIPTCQKCLSLIKTTYTINNSQYKALTIPRPDPPYVIFQHESFDKKNVKKRYLEIVPVEPGNMITIGRSTEASISLLMDESLEGGHCQLFYDQELKKFLITDLGSSYGTLVQAKESILIRPHHPNVRIQIKNVAIDLNVKRAESLEQCQNYDAGNKLFEDQVNLVKEDDWEFFL